eukprot:NODE_4090_length_711_cov_426.782012.p1 GENE.NODE_4090_length_711_cov_426.782012~~NODE_4090_length_711_cov_426.782012.p1  ORF type:complete len:197 (-),score=67.02 NODE_4090_length_711_cov_426.782012:106-618(-)
MVRVIGGVFLHETFRSAASDDDLMTIQKQRAATQHAVKMKTLMARANNGDVSDDTLSVEEFKQCLDDPKIRSWLESQEISTKEVDLLFVLLDDSGDGEVSLKELTEGIARLKGAARSLDLHALMHMVYHLYGVVEARLPARLEPPRTEAEVAAFLRATLHPQTEKSPLML